jgi:hypothetical protein
MQIALIHLEKLEKENLFPEKVLILRTAFWV